MTSLESVSSLLLALKECKRDLLRVRELHSEVSRTGLLSNKYIVSALITRYSDCGSMAEARRVFDCSRIAPDVVSWTALIAGYVHNDQSEQALQIFDSMRCAPNSRTFVAAIAACSALVAKTKVARWIERGKELHSRALQGNCWDMFVETTLINFYAQCGCMAEARKIFDGMKQRNVVTWTVLMQGYVANGESEVALKIYEFIERDQLVGPDSRIYVAALTAITALADCLRKDPKSSGSCNRFLEKGREIHSTAVKKKCVNIFLETTLVDMFAKCGQMQLAREVFDKMPQRNVVAWNALLMGYAYSGENEEVLTLVAAMDTSGVAANATTYLAAVMASGHLLCVEAGRYFHSRVRSCGLEKDLVVGNCLVDFYGKCGCLEDAKQVFDSIPGKDVISWTSLMGGYSHQGKSDMVFKLFEQMRGAGIRPNEATFVCVLAACSHAGLTEKGNEYFNMISSEFGMQPSIRHYACMVDLLGRANCLGEALRVVRNMPLEGNAVIWRAMLSACRKWNNLVIGKVAYENLLRFGEHDARAYVFLAGVYDGASRAENGEAIASIASGGAQWIDETGKLHRFVAGGRTERSLNEWGVCY